MKYFHATTEENFEKILATGAIKTGTDGITYMTLNATDAVKFLIVRGIRSVIVLELELDESYNIKETFDHSFAFFKCKCFGTDKEIPLTCIKSAPKFVF